MTAPPKLIELVENFDYNHEEYTATSYNEDSARNDFIDPFFECLGWDVNNKDGKNEAWRDVLREHSIKSGPTREAPDYLFKIGKTNVFIVEAKKPAVSIAKDMKSALQARTYGWNMKLGVAILTNFREFAAYDCRQRPKKTDKAGAARILYYTHHDYPQKWDEISRIFARQSVERGELDKFMESGKKRSTLEVDQAFLQEIEEFRKILASNIALRNPALSQRELNFAVQVTIDRMIFLRICEDRGIEPPARIMSLLNRKDIYKNLFKLFEDADDRYNSGLFHFTEEKGRASQPDTITSRIRIDDDKLKKIIKSLYENEYDFSLIPVEILGQIYERFLGNVIYLTPGHQARVQEKPEVKKAGGVYYTPSYIVDYIVENTVGKLLENKTPNQVAKLKILDPACGSGSFLIGAFEKLMQWHLDYYSKNPGKNQKKIFPVIGGGHRLFTAEKKRILLNNVYGVDIDPQAVEVTKLSLLLKILEGESEESINKQLRLFQERALPDLGNNIKCGNSLIGPDFYSGKQINMFDQEELYKINAFDWKQEFPHAFKGNNPGFDAVIGNPPYGALFSDKQVEYFKHKFISTIVSCDSFALFMEQSSSLLKNSGVIGMIVQSAWVSSPSLKSLRELFISRFKPLAFATMPYDVFGAYVDTIITIAEKLNRQMTLSQLSEAKVDLIVFPPRFKITSIEDFQKFKKSADSKKWIKDKHDEFLVTLSDEERNIIDKMQSIGGKLSDVADIQRGVTPFKISEEKPKINAFKAFNGTVRRYKLLSSSEAYIRFDKTLAEYKPQRYFQGPRLLLRELISRQFRLQAVYVDKDFITNKSMQSIILSNRNYHIYYILGIINSTLMSWYFLAISSVGRRDDFPKIVLKQTRELPFRKIDFSNHSENVTHDDLVTLVGRMIDLNKRLDSVNTPHEQNLLQRQIDATDKEIDFLVYELYGLTEEEIRIVEESV